MKLLLDTHAFMWWHSEPEYIPKSTLILLQDPNHEVILSVVSLWEMQIKIQLQQFAFKPATNKNIKPIAGLRPATLLVAGLINNCCR